MSGPLGPGPDLTGPNPSEGGVTLDGGAGPEDRYRRGALLGVGGMGRVYAALDERLGREVALKEVKPGAGPGAAERLAREVRVTALLEHPGIVPVYDAGPGHGYYTMRLVRGRSLADALRAAPRREDRLALLRRVLGACEALAYAHSVGVVHRDVKPDNVMIGEFGQTLVVDWGLARVIPGSRVATAASIGGVSDAGLTQAGAVLGTPRYMSPEQAAGATATPAADVWSLGALLYELVAGAPPYAGDDAYDVLRRARAAEPTPLATVAPDAPAELVAIVTRALARAPEDRYPTAGELADDLTRYLDGRRVAAHDYSGAELARRFARRWRVALGLGALALFAVLATAGIGWWRTSSALERAIGAEAEAKAALTRGDAWLADALVQQALVAEGRDAVPEAEVLAANALTLGGSPVARGILAGLAVAERPVRVGPIATPDGCDDVILTPDASVALCRVGVTLSAWSTEPLARRWSLDLDVREIVPFAPDRAVAWLDGDALALVDLDTGAQLATFGPFHIGHGVGASADGAYLTFGAPGLFRVLDVATGRTVPGPWEAGLVASWAFAGDRIVVMQRDGRLLDGPVGGPIQSFETPFSGRSEARTVRHLPGGGWLVGTVSGQVARLDASAKTVAHVDGFSGAILGASVLPDGRTVVVHGALGAPQVFDLATSAWRGRFPSGEGQRVSVGPDGAVIIGPDPAWRWRVPSDVAPRVMAVGDGVTSLDVSPDGRWLAAAAGAGRALVWDLTAASPARDLKVNAAGAVIKDVVFAADDGLFTVDTMGGLTAVGARRPSTGSEAYRRVGVLRDGDRSVVWTLGYGVSSPKLWDVATGDEVTTVRVPGRELFEGEPSADRTAAALLDTEGRVYVLRGGPVRIEPVLTRDGATAVDVVPALGLVAVGGGRRVEVVRLSDGATVVDVDPGARVVDLALAPDGGRVAATDTAGRVRVWSVPSGALVADLRGHADRVAAVRFSPDSATLFTADWSGQVRRWRLDVLDADPERLRAEIEQAWGVDLEGALGG